MSNDANLPNHGELKEFLTQVKEKRFVDKDQVLNDIATLIRKLPMSADQLSKLQAAVASRTRFKTCGKCAKLQPENTGALVWLDGDMSKPKRFVCGDCK